MPIITKKGLIMDILSDRTKREIQMKLGHYLASFRKNRGLTQEDMATRLGYSLSQYKRTELGLEPRVANAVEFLAVFSSLTEKSVPEFVQYLQSIPIEQRANLAENEVTLLSSFNSIALDSRRKFIRHYCLEEKSKLSPLIEIANSLQKLTPAQLIVVQFLTSVVLPQSDTNNDIDSALELTNQLKNLLEVYEKSLTSGEVAFPSTI